MRIVADQNIPYVAEAFASVGDVTALPTAQITNAVAREADVLVIRNETAVNAELLDGSPVCFIASATAGTDHVDIDYLTGAGIGFANAPGCNANSVVEYVVASLLFYAARKQVSLPGKTLAVIGVGAIGSKVVKAAEALGLDVMRNDPPLARTTGDAKFADIEDALTADFVTLHTPLTTGGPDATYHLFDDARFARMKPTAVLINSSRGAVVQTVALRRALERGRIADALIDVWEHEPAIDAGLASRCAVATAHVAGYSMEGKLAAVQMVRDAACRFFAIATRWESSRHLPPIANPQLASAKGSEEGALHDIVRQAYDVAHDDEQLRRVLALPPPDLAAGYVRLRTGYRERREFSGYTVWLRPEQECVRPALCGLGFKTRVIARQAAGRAE